jgi:CubicO group peptidase (beta-lactamase class C family)
MSSIGAKVTQADEVDDLIKTKMIERSIPGLQLAIVKNGKMIKSQSYGEANLQHSVKVTNETVFPINSMTKLFTGVAIMQLVEQGKLTLDDPIGAHLPQLPTTWHHLTIKQLFSHTSGLPNILSGRNIDLIANNDPQAAWTLVQQKPLKFKANSQFQYNQTGYVILGKIINKLTNQDFTQFITDNQLTKVGMPLTEGAGFAYLEDIIPNQANQYTLRRNGELRTVYGEFAPLMRTAAGMSATANELALYSIALQKGVLLNNASLKALWTPNTLNSGRTAGFSTFENGYAIGWQVEKRKIHRGVSASGGDANTLIIYPEDDLSIVVLTNRLGALPIQFVDEIASIYLTDMKLKNGWKDPVNVLKKQAQAHEYKSMLDIVNRVEKNFGIYLNVGEINQWGYELVNQNNIEAAIAVFKLNTTLNPEIANTFDSLGEAYGMNKQYKKSLENYQKVLMINPENQWAKKQIEALKDTLKKG